MEITASQFNGDLILAASKLQPGNTLSVDIPVKLPSTLKLAVQDVELHVHAPITCTGTGVAIEMRAPGCGLTFHEHGIIFNSNMASVMVDAGADDCWIERLKAVNYNVSGSVHGAIFLNGCKNIIVDRCITMNGNGNGIRLQNVDVATIERNHIHSTGGGSAEGFTVQGSSNVAIRENWIDRAWSTGLLIYDQNSDIAIEDNLITNGSQWPLYTHPAIALNPNGKTLNGVTVIGNKAIDNQPVHTMECLMALQGTGTIQNGTVDLASSYQDGTILSTMLVKSSQAVSGLNLVNWVEK